MLVILLWPFGFLAPKTLYKLFNFPIFLIWPYLMKGIPGMRFAHYIRYRIYIFYNYHRVDNSADELLVPECITRSVVSVPTLAWPI
jgi:hypothetical protein